MSQRVAEFLVNTGLYVEGLEISKVNYEEIRLFLEGEYKIEAYCHECESDRIFSSQELTLGKRSSYPPLRFFL